MDYKLKILGNEPSFIEVQDASKSTPIKTSQLLQASNILNRSTQFPSDLFNKEESLVASHMMTQLAVVHIMAAQEKQRQTVLQMLAVQQFQRNLIPNVQGFHTQKQPETTYKNSVEVDGLDLLGTAAVFKRAPLRPSIISTTSSDSKPQEPAIFSSSDTVSSSDSTITEDPEESRRKANQPRKYIDAIGENDVLCGRGGRSNHHIGNKRYRQVVGRMKCAYQSCPAKALKTDLSRAIVDHCCSYGARFVKLDEEYGQYYILSRSEARKKTSQALRESKVIKWTA